MCTEPLSLSMGCLEDSGVNGEFLSPHRFSTSTTNSLNRRKIKPKPGLYRKSWGPSDKDAGKQEFWASIQEPYDFIMGTHLMPETYEINGRKEHCSNSGELELCWDPSDVTPSYEWSYSEFLDQYNELYEWLIQVQLKLYSHSNPPDKASRMVQFEELHRQTYRRKIFVEQGCNVAQRYPSSAEEISWRVNYLNNKWDQLLTTLTPVKGQTQIEVDLDLAHEEGLLCGWLSTMEGQIQPLTCRLPRGLSVETLQERYKGNQILLKDIEAHGPILKSVLRQYERLDSSDANSNCKSANAKNIDSTSPSETPSTTTNTTYSQFSAIDPSSRREKIFPFSFQSASPTPKSSARIKVPRRARSLEKRWHQVYLRSLEWHYYLEGAIANFKNLVESCSSESDDEPVTKCRRLSYSSSSSSSSSRRLGHTKSWSLYEFTPSEEGSYIEDDYVSVSGVPMVSDHRRRVKNKTVIDDAIVPCLNPDITSMDVVDQFEALQNTEMKESVINMNCGTDPEDKWSKENISKLTEVDRPYTNCGVFDCKHPDTDSEDQNKGVDVECANQDNKERIVRRKEIVQRRYIRSTKTTIESKHYYMKDDEEVDQDALQDIIDSAILDQNWLDSNLTSDSESMDSVPIIDLSENIVKGVGSTLKVEKTENSIDHLIPLIRKEPLNHACSTESITKLISDVEHLVSNVSREDNLIMSPRQCLKPLSFGSVAASKQHRIKQWLSSQSDTASLQDSCDASGELTTGDSDSECNSSNHNPTTIYKASTDIPGSSEDTPTAECLPFSNFCGDNISKVVRRGKKRTQNEQRPWSISELHQISLIRNSKGPAIPPLQEPLQTMNLLSSSETALNKFQSYNLEATTPLALGDSFSLGNSSLENEGLRTPPSSSPSISPSKSASNSESPQTIVPRSSITLSSTESLKKRRSKFRRRSLNYLGRRADSGSDEKHKEARISDTKSILYSPYQISLTNPISSDSDSASQCPRFSKSLQLSLSVGLSGGGGITSSTEQYLSDSSLVSGVPKTSVSVSESSLKRANSSHCPPTLLLPQTPRTITSDNDVSNTQEDISSLSEQAWDPYQEYKYLSEPYSEDVDHDAVRRLLDFGDDYSKYIDSECSSLRFPPRRRRSPHHKKIRTFKSRPSADSDSDIDDLHHVIQESKSQLDAMESVLEKHSPETTICLDFGELLTTIKTNLKCLHEILKHLEMDAPDLQTELNDVRGIIHRWTVLESKAMDRQRQSSQLRQLQRQVKNLKLGLESISDRCSTLAHPHSMALPSQLKQKVEEAKNLLEETEKLKVDLSSLNVVVHRFVVDIGPSVSPLKEEVTDLYRIFEDTQRRVSAEITRLESAEATWGLWEEQKQQLLEALKQDQETLKILDTAIDTGRVSESITASVQNVAKLLNQKRRSLDDRGGDLDSSVLTNTQISITDVLDVNKRCEQPGVIEENRDDHLSDSGTSGYESCSSDDLSERERRLAYLRRLARDLEANLAPGSKAWSEICVTLAQAEKELRGLQNQCQNLILKTAENFDKGALKSGFAQNSNKRKAWTHENKRALRPDKRRNGRGSNRGWIGRVARAALPFQVALLLLFCVACLLEPNCCDSVNTLNLSFSPQLRYVHGAPPT